MTNSDASAESDEFYRLLAIPFRHARGVVFAAGALSVLVGTMTLFKARTYTSTALLSAKAQDDQSSRLAGVVAQLGVGSVGGLRGGSPPEYYVAELTSRDVLGATVDTEYTWSDADTSVRGDLAAYFEIDEKAPARRKELAVGALREALDVVPDPVAGLVGVRVKLRSAGVAHQVVVNLVHAANDVESRVRSDRGRLESDFIQQQLGVVHDEVKTAEGELLSFLVQNRQIDASPTLSFRQARLRERLEQLKDVETSLEVAWQNSRLGEMRRTPTLAVLDGPTSPVIPDPRLLVVKVLVSFVAGLIGSILVVTGFEMMFGDEVGQPNPRAYLRSEMVHTWATLRRALRLPWPKPE